MEPTKPCWSSKTLWVNAIAVLAAILGAFSIDIGLDAETQVMVVGAVMGVVNLVLRFMTDTGVGT